MKECKVLDFSFHSGQAECIAKVPFVQDPINEYLKTGWQINNVLKDGACLLVILVK